MKSCTYERPQLLPLDSLEHGSEREAQLPVNATGLLDLFHTYVQGDSSGCGLGRDDWNSECSTACPILPRLVGIWQKWLGRWAGRWNTQIKVNPTQIHEQMGHPVGEIARLLTHPVALADTAGVLEVARPGEAERAAVKVAVGEHVGEAEGVVVFL